MGAGDAGAFLALALASALLFVKPGGIFLREEEH